MFGLPLPLQGGASVVWPWAALGQLLLFGGGGCRTSIRIHHRGGTGLSPSPPPPLPPSPPRGANGGRRPRRDAVHALAVHGLDAPVDGPVGWVAGGAFLTDPPHPKGGGSSLRRQKHVLAGKGLLANTPPSPHRARMKSLHDGRGGVSELGKKGVPAGWLLQAAGLDPLPQPSPAQEEGGMSFALNKARVDGRESEPRPPVAEIRRDAHQRAAGPPPLAGLRTWRWGKQAPPIPKKDTTWVIIAIDCWTNMHREKTDYGPVSRTGDMPPPSMGPWGWPGRRGR